MMNTAAVTTKRPRPPLVTKLSEMKSAIMPTSESTTTTKTMMDMTIKNDLLVRRKRPAIFLDSPFCTLKFTTLNVGD